MKYGGRCGKEGLCSVGIAKLYLVEVLVLPGVGEADPHLVVEHEHGDHYFAVGRVMGDLVRGRCVALC